MEPAERFRCTKVGLVELVKLRYVILVGNMRQLLAFNDISRNQTRNDMQHGDSFIDLRISARYKALIVTD